MQCKSDHRETQPPAMRLSQYNVWQYRYYFSVGWRYPDLLAGHIMYTFVITSCFIAACQQLVLNVIWNDEILHNILFTLVLVKQWTNLYNKGDVAVNYFVRNWIFT